MLGKKSPTIKVTSSEREAHNAFYAFKAAHPQLAIEHNTIIVGDIEFEIQRTITFIQGDHRRGGGHAAAVQILLVHNGLYWTATSVDYHARNANGTYAYHFRVWAKEAPCVDRYSFVPAKIDTVDYEQWRQIKLVDAEEGNIFLSQLKLASQSSSFFENQR